MSRLRRTSARDTVAVRMLDHESLQSGWITLEYPRRSRLLLRGVAFGALGVGCLIPFVALGLEFPVFWGVMSAALVLGGMYLEAHARRARLRLGPNGEIERAGALLTRIRNASEFQSFRRLAHTQRLLYGKAGRKNFTLWSSYDNNPEELDGWLSRWIVDLDAQELAASAREVQEILNRGEDDISDVEGLRRLHAHGETLEWIRLGVIGSVFIAAAGHWWTPRIVCLTAAMVLAFWIQVFVHRYPNLVTIEAPRPTVRVNLIGALSGLAVLVFLLLGNGTWISNLLHFGIASCVAGTAYGIPLMWRLRRLPIKARLHQLLLCLLFGVGMTYALNVYADPSIATVVSVPTQVRRVECKKRGQQDCYRVVFKSPGSGRELWFRAFGPEARETRAVDLQVKKGLLGLQWIERIEGQN